MKDKIIDFLDSNNIYYITKGKNVRKGNVNIQCPFCGSLDNSQHMGIKLENGIYGCWRDSSHNGRDFAKLIQVLIDVSYQEACRLWKTDVVPLGSNSLLSQVNEKFRRDDEVEKVLGGVDRLVIPKEFAEIKKTGTKKRFFDYFIKRGFASSDVMSLIEYYGIKCCNVGYWKNRIIFPIYYEKKLVTWVGRSLYNNAALLYMDLSIEKSVRHSKFCLYNYDELMKTSRKIGLFITEGLFDCIKLNYFLSSNYEATCLFTKTIRDEQKYLLKELSHRFEKIILLLDKDASTEILRMERELCFIDNVSFKFLDVKDPGIMNKEQVLSLL